jgi:membrane-bound lytic murein transglycosylase D
MSVDATLRPGRTLRLPERRPALVAGAGLLANTAAASGAPPPRPAGSVPGASTGSVEASADAGLPSGGIYVVRRGEALSDIARGLHMSAADLIRYNHLRDADFVFEGQKLRLTPDTGVTDADVAPALAAAVPTPVPAPRVTAGGNPPFPDSALPSGLSPIFPTPAVGPQTVSLVGTPPRAAVLEPEGLPDPGKAEPVSRSQAEALGPSLVPGGGATPQVTDVVDYSVARDGTVHVAAAETIGHYAEWLGISAGRLRALNHLGSGASLLVGQKLRLDFSRAKLEQFEQRRRDYHLRLQSDFFDAHRIEGTEIYVARRGDSLWTVTQRYPRLPAWLLEEYNPDTDFGELRPGTQLIVPKVEDVAATN